MSVESVSPPRRKPKLLVADLFCGAGGSSTGATKALQKLGYDMELVCVNHWPVAIETHKKNHPSARHYCINLDSARPIELVPEGYLDLLMASPECIHHSRARGGRPMNDQSRMSAWHVVRWATDLRVKVILIENVEEFAEWGPLNIKTGRPLQSRKGTYFLSFLNALRGIGFKVDYRIVNAADYGDATTRRRLFIIARSDGKPIRWPEPTHFKDGGEDLFGGKMRWRAAKEIIDWDVPGNSIFTRKKPLAPKTLSRIYAGAQKFGWPEPFLVVLRQHMGAASINAPLPTITAGGKHVGVAEPVLTPFLLNRHGDNGSVRVHSVEKPVPTATTRGAGYLVEPDITPFTLSQGSKGAPRACSEPLPTILGAGAVSLTEAVIVNMKGKSTASPIGAPVPTLTAHAKHIAVAEPLIAPYYGSGSGETCKSAESPLDTVTAKARFALVEPSTVPFIAPFYGPKGGKARCSRSVERPLATQGASNRFGLVEPFLVPQFGERDGQSPRCHDVRMPLPAVTGHGAGAVVQPCLITVAHGDMTELNAPKRRVHDVEEPLPTITAGGGEPAIIEPRLSPIKGVSQTGSMIVQTDQYGSNGSCVRSAEDPLFVTVTKQNQALVDATLSPVDDTAKPPYGALVSIEGEPYLVDIRFRMLRNVELARAMGFTDEESEYEFVGTAGEVTKQIGNAVPVHLAMALVGSCFGD